MPDLPSSSLTQLALAVPEFERKRRNNIQLSRRKVELCLFRHNIIPPGANKNLSGFFFLQVAFQPAAVEMNEREQFPKEQVLIFSNLERQIFLKIQKQKKAIK